MSMLISAFRQVLIPSAMLLVLMCSIISALGQGQGSVSFGNLGVTDAKKVWLAPVETNFVAGTNYFVALYWAASDVFDETQFVQIGPVATFLTGNNAGTFFGGGRTITTSGSAVNGPVLNFQVRAWRRFVDGVEYATYESARDATVSINGIELGKSGIFQLKTKDLTNPLETTPNIHSAPGYAGFPIIPQPPVVVISQQPNDQTVYLGQDISFSVAATAPSQSTYQWQFNGTSIPDATNTALVITNASIADAGSYRVVISTDQASLMSSPATLIVLLRGISLAVQGSGVATKTPDKEHYEFNEPVTLSAFAGRWHRFQSWSDGLLDNPRVIAATNGPNEYVAYFSPTTVLETVTIGGVSRTAPVGMPLILVDGRFVTDPAVTNDAAVEITIQTTLPNGVIFWTRDGSKPNILTSAPYFEPFQLRGPVTLRVVAYSSDFTRSVEADPLQILPLYHLSVTTPGGGRVTLSPFLPKFAANSVVTLTAIPDDGWRFLGWLGALSGIDQTNSITMNGDQCVRAVFGTALSTNISGSGIVTVSPAAEWYPYGTFVQCFAAPDIGNSFVLWSMAGVNTNNPLQFSVTSANPTISAAFQALPQSQFALAVIADGMGEVSVSPRGNRFPNRQRVTLAATAAPFQTFLGWSGDAIGAQNPITITVNRSQTITAHFSRRPVLTTDACPSTLPGESTRFRLTGELGSVFSLEHSSDLQQWSPFATVTNILGVVEWSPPADPRPDADFFRVISGQ